MKRILMLTMLVLIAGVGLYAQQGSGRGTKRSPEERAAFTVQRLTATITMTSEEQAKVTEVFNQFYTEQEPLRAERNRTKMLELAAGRDAKVKAILNDDTKYDTYVKFMEAQRNRAGGKSKGGGKRSSQ